MASKIWQEEWSYHKHAELTEASSQIITTITELGIDRSNQEGNECSVSIERIDSAGDFNQRLK